MKEMHSIFESIVSFFDQQNWDKGILLLSLRKNWKEIVGDYVANHSFPSRITGNTLLIGVDNNVLMQQLSLQKHVIQERIYKLTSQQFDVKFMFKRKKKRTKKLNRRNLSSKELREIHDLVSRMKDRELSKLLANVIVKLEERKG